jgi:8-oxo-dGTP pyrophosphatase MutT (NUDIX family)
VIALPAWLDETLRFEPGTLLPFVVDGDRVGWVRDDLRELLGSRWSSVFVLREGELRLHERFDTPSSRTQAMAEVLTSLRETGWVHGWRDEHYMVYGEIDGSPKFSMERAAVKRFGVRGHATHVNGVVRTATGISLWIARRSVSKAVDPGRFDNIVGGGIEASSTVEATLVKECWEEAGIAADLARRAVPVAGVCFECHDPEGVDANQLFAFDLELAPDFVPVNQDGEVQGFELVPSDRVLEMIETPELMTVDAALVTLACLERWADL